MVNTIFNLHTKKHGLLRRQMWPLPSLPQIYSTVFITLRLIWRGQNFSSSAPTVDLTPGQNPGVVITEVP